MAPPKRKGGGRVTPKGTRPGENKLPSAGPSGSSGQGPVRTQDSAYHAVERSSRYQPPVPKYVKESPRWVPILMFTLLGLGLLTIIGYYLVSPLRHQYFLLGGLAFILGGLYTATKWH